MPTERYHLGAAEVINNIYIIGGFSSTLGLLNSVEALGTYELSAVLGNVNEIYSPVKAESIINDEVDIQIDSTTQISYMQP